MFPKKKNLPYSQDDHAIIEKDRWNKILTDKEVLEYFAPYADLSVISTYPQHNSVEGLGAGFSSGWHQADLFDNDESLKELEAKVLADKAVEEERLRLLRAAEEEKKRRAEEAERKRRERERKKNHFFNRFKKGFDNLSGELFGSDDNADTMDAGEVSYKPLLDADFAFTYESRKLIKEVEERINRLREMGVNTAILEQLIHQPEKLSRLLITKDYDIFLPDYHNMEIKMAPLNKAVFILFLRHSEGIIFKHLPDYRNELWDIYYKLKDGMVSESHRKSIDDVTNPFNNSINEKCARIREAFVSKFDERLANHYVIDGPRGEAKRIDLPRDLVIWE